MPPARGRRSCIQASTNRTSTKCGLSRGCFIRQRPTTPPHVHNGFARPARTLVKLFHSIFACCIAVAVIGCGPKKQPPQARADDFQNPKWDVTPLSIKQSSVAVTEGPAPLVHLFDSSRAVRVMDVTANAQVAACMIGDRTLVSVDQRRGVVAGSTVLAPG